MENSDTNDRSKSNLILSSNEIQLILYILEESIIKLSFFRARHQDINGRFDLRFLRDRACETYMPPYKPISRKEVDLCDWKLAWDLSLLQKSLIICRDELSEAGTFTTMQQLVSRKQELQLDEKRFTKQKKQPANHKVQAYNKEEEEEEQFEKLKSQQKKLINYFALIEKQEDLLRKKMVINSSKIKFLDLSREDKENFCLICNRNPLRKCAVALDLYEETAYRCKSIRTYFELYQKSRIDQMKHKMKFTQEVLRQKMFKIIKDEEYEKTAHDRIMAFLQEALKRLDEKLVYWTEERRKDVAWRNDEIKKVDEEMLEVTRIKKELYLDYDRREEEMRVYLVEREVRRQREAEEEARRRCAVRIQAWWRGCMVRFNLGPFSPDHLKKKKKKCKKK